MAYYDALISKWATLNGTTAQKLSAINALTVNGAAIPMVVPTYRIYNLIAPSEFGALTAANQQLIRDILGMGVVDASPGTSVRARVIAIFPSNTATFASLSALAATFDTPQVLWWQATVEQGGGGLGSRVSADDLRAAGNLS
jgi:hypothetical protein